MSTCSNCGTDSEQSALVDCPDCGDPFCPACSNGHVEGRAVYRSNHGTPQEAIYHYESCPHCESWTRTVPGTGIYDSVDTDPEADLEQQAASLTDEDGDYGYEIIDRQA